MRKDLDIVSSVVILLTKKDKAGIMMKYEPHYDSNLFDQSTTKWLRDIAFKKLKDGNNFIDLMRYGKTSLWWYMDLPLYYLLKDLVRRSERKINFNKKIHIDVNFVQLIFFIFVGLIYLFLKTVARFGCSIFMSKPKRNNLKKNTILVPSSSLSWRETNFLQEKGKIDIAINNVLKTLSSNNNFRVIACDVCDRFPGFGIKQLFEKDFSEPTLWLPIEAYLSFSVLEKTFRRWLDYITKYILLKRGGEINNVLIRDFNAENSKKIIKLFDKFFGFNLLNSILEIELLKNAIKKENANLIMTYCDHCSFGRSSIVAGNEMRIPSLSLQTALLTLKDREYMYNNAELHTFPKPTVLAVTGRYFQDILMKILGKNNIYNWTFVVVGQPKYDMLNKRNLYSKDDFIERNGILPNKKIVLVTTQPVDLELPPESRDLLIASIFDNLKNDSGIELLIKPHPRDNDNVYYENLKNTNPFAYILDKNSDIYEAIYACDVLVTHSSTTALEAMVLNKPVIIINLTNEPDILPYVQCGAAIGVYKKEDLEKKLKETLFNEDTRIRMQEDQKKFLYEVLYNQDGRASERIADLIIQMIEDHRGVSTYD